MRRRRGESSSAPFDAKCRRTPDVVAGGSGSSTPLRSSIRDEEFPNMDTHDRSIDFEQSAHVTDTLAPPITDLDGAYGVVERLRKRLRMAILGRDEVIE